ncbi:kinase [Nocardia terpenica]|uniref:phosphotransferase-like protein n=1 Tax=Nocardia terpenica TaxID=455432 RepID=UPI002FE2368A
MASAIILYGPPASGKDAITGALTSINPAFTLFRRLKVGAGRTATYRMTSADHVAALADSGDIIWQNSRYDATYVVDRPELAAMLATNHIPVLHLGQPEAIAAVRAAMPGTRFITVELWCPRDLAEDRIRARATGDKAARLAAWDATARLRPNQVDLRIDTGQYLPAESATMIMETLESSWRST